VTQVVPVIVRDCCIKHLSAETIHVTHMHIYMHRKYLHNISSIINITALTAGKN